MGRLDSAQRPGEDLNGYEARMQQAPAAGKPYRCKRLVWIDTLAAR